MMTNVEKRQLAEEIVDYLSDNGVIDTCIYVNGCRWDRSPYRKYDYKDYTPNGNEFYVEVGVRPENYLEYTSPNDVINMSFEGELYDAFNGYGSSFMYRDMEEIFEKHNCFFELGQAWSLNGVEL